MKIQRKYLLLFLICERLEVKARLGPVGHEIPPTLEDVPEGGVIVYVLW